MPYRPRAARDRERMATVADVARVMGGSAMDTALGAALAQIGAAFGAAAAVNDFKLRAERSIRLGPQHAAVRARFGARAALFSGRDLDTAIAVTERCWRDERKAFQLASALGYGNGLSLGVLRELRLILRLMRSRRMRTQFGTIVATLCDDTLPLAAE
jgi:hypothetical protein